MVTEPGGPAAGADSAAADLRLRLGPLVRRLAWALGDSSRTGRLLGSETPGTVTQRHAAGLLARIEEVTAGTAERGPELAFTEQEHARLVEVARQAESAGSQTPCSVLLGRGLDETDLSVLLLAVAPLLEPAFGGLYAYLQESFEATFAGERLIVRLLASCEDQVSTATVAAGPFGRLRSWGLLEPTTPDRLAGVLLRPAPGVVEMIQGSAVDLGLLGVPGVAQPPGALPVGLAEGEVLALARALGKGSLDVVGIWGACRQDADSLVLRLLGEVVGGQAAPRVSLSSAAVGLQRAAVAGLPCVVQADEQDADAAELLELLALSTTPCILLAPRPLDLPALWGVRRVAELQVPAPGGPAQVAAWAAAFPHLAPDRVGDLAGRFTLTAGQLEAVAAQRQVADWRGESSPPSLEELAVRVSRPRRPALASLVQPSRGRELLVLPPETQARVIRVAEDFRAWPGVSEAWRLDRFGGRGVTALFAGPPGTGKTLAAEVIAGEVGLDLMVVDLSLLVSKWIGETEKNLDAVFTDASGSHCVLFFDEADTVFGRRGEISRGTDRYANLQVGYLLQRLERYDGLVVLATNLHDQLDDAFARRFHHVVHFPRPGADERRRLWELVLSEPVVLAEPVDLEVLTEIEMTGAGVASVVRSAALAAHHDRRAALTMGDLVLGLARTLQREGRLVPRDLAESYSVELGGPR